MILYTENKVNTCCACGAEIKDNVSPERDVVCALCVQRATVNYDPEKGSKIREIFDAVDKRRRE
jgi:hypothetical protein